MKTDVLKASVFDFGFLLSADDLTWVTTAP